MLSFILNTKLFINKQQIACRVTGDPDEVIDKGTFILMIPDGPGFCSAVFESEVASLSATIKSKNKRTCHFILFDPLGCGDSENADDLNSSYTVESYTEVAAKVVEAIKRKLNLAKIDLTVYGMGFGGLIALNLPTLRPAWVEMTSGIRLLKIITTSTPNTRGKFIFRLIQDQKDYVKMAMDLAPFYSDSSEKARQNLYARMFRRYPLIVVAMIRLMSFFVAINLTQRIFGRLAGFNVDVFNQFSVSTEPFNLAGVVADNKPLYEKVAICCIAGSRDYVTNAKDCANQLRSVLPHIAKIIFDGKYAIHVDSPQLYRNIIESILTDSAINPSDLHCEMDAHGVVECELPDEFKRLLLVSAPAPAMKRSTTVQCLEGLAALNAFVEKKIAAIQQQEVEKKSDNECEDDCAAEYDPRFEQNGLKLR